MPEIIKMINTTDAVTIEVDVNGAAILWEYDYEDRDTHFTGKSTDAPPHKHTIGLPGDLDGQTDAWTIRLVNSLPTSIGYQVQVVWKQGITVINTWTRTGTAAPTSPVNRGDTGDLSF